MTEEAELVRQLYAAFNRQDAESLLALVTDDVDWPDGSDRLHGRDALGAYWRQRWADVRTHDEPRAVTLADDDRVEVRVEQTVRAPDGSPVSTGRFLHVFRLRAGVVARLDIEQAAHERRGS